MSLNSDSFADGAVLGAPIVVTAERLGMNSGVSVIQDGATGGKADGGFFDFVLGSLARGVSTAVDVVVAERINRTVGDRADVIDRAPALDQSQPRFQLSNVRLTPIQIGGFGIAAVLALALVTGKFR